MLPLLATCTAFNAPATAFHAGGSCLPPARHAAAICSSTRSAGPLIRSAFLSLIAGQSAFALATEVPSLFSSSPDVFGTLFDAGFLFYSGRLLAGQAGLVGGDEALAEKLAGLDCTCTLSIGREPGTWMPKEWGASGARLSLPLQLRFSEETADLGFPGEESMTGRTARQLCCPSGGSFVGQAGTVRVEPTGGAWSVKPTRQPGVGELRFFLDFPTEAARNDVTLPAGRALAAPAPSTGLGLSPGAPLCRRVFFSGTCVDPELAQALGPTPGDVFVAPGSGVRLFGEGGVTTKRTDARNLYGALGETFLILGRFSLVPPPPPQASEDETPQQRAARERAEDEARGRAV